VACSEDSASLLLLELGLAWVLALDLGHAQFFLTLRVFLLLLFVESSKGNQLYGGETLVWVLRY
jgi:hypothetical protein